jgi:hypothetical protein
MNRLHTELRLLRWPLLQLGLAALLALALCLVSWHFIQDSARQADAAEKAAEQLRNQAARLQSEEHDMRAKIAQYTAINARGIIGDEHRLDWVELVRTIQRERKLLGLEYEIQPRQRLAGNAATSNGTGYIFMSSAMKVQMPLLHEDDLLRFLGDIRASAAAFTRLRSCKLQRGTAPSMQEDSGMRAQLNAECQIDWITLAPESTVR